MTEGPGRHSSWRRRWGALVGATVAAILALTLFPSGNEKLPPMLDCIFCGERGAADVILNVILFLPLGAALDLAEVPLPTASVASALLSAAIEAAQLFIPGRDTSLSDVLTNTIGAVLGWLLIRHAPRLVASRGLPATLLATAASILPACGVAVFGLLLHPALPHSTYYGQWTPNLGHLEWYRGRVLSASLGELPLPPRRLDNSDTVRALVLAGAVLRVRAIGGPSVPALASLVSIYDGEHREIVLLGPDRGDLVFRYRTRAAALRLNQPDLRVEGAFAPVRPGDTLAIALWRERTGYCASLNGARTCPLRVPAGRGWALLLYPAGFPPWLRLILDACWLAGLFVPAGLCALGPRVAWAGGGVVVSLGVLPSLVGLQPAPLISWAGASAGFGIGVGLRALARRRGLG